MNKSKVNSVTKKAGKYISVVGLFVAIVEVWTR